VRNPLVQLFCECARAFYQAACEVKMMDAMPGCVQVFERRGCRSHHVLMRPAFEKRQGTKSRSVVRWRCGRRYGDLAAV
jgi:hypothetical protein